MLTKDYVVGLVDGEGSFTAFVRDPDKPKKAKRRVWLEPRFYLKLIREDKKILTALRSFFGCGRIYLQRDRRPNHQDCYRFEVANREQLDEVIVPFFKENHLRLPSKRRDFKLFVEIMGRIRKKEHLTLSGLKKILRVKQKMH